MVSTPVVNKSNRRAATGRRGTDKSQTPASRSQKTTSDVRKEQNKNASRVYRERRKQRLALLEQLLEKERDLQNESQDALQTAGAGVLTGKDAAETCELTASAVSHSQPVFRMETSGDSGEHAANVLAPWGSADLFSLDSLLPSAQTDVPCGPPLSSHSSTDPRQEALPTVAAQRPTSSGELVATAHSYMYSPSSPFRLEYPSSVTNNNGSSSILTQSPQSPQSPSSSLSRQRQGQTDESLQSFFNNLMSLSAPDVRQVIYVQQNGLFGAVMENTLALGLLKGAEMIFSQDGASPFNRDWIASNGAMQLSEIRSKFAATPRDLQPLDIQITVAHHVYLDVLPFPVFRDKALRALTCDPPLFDEDELCVDITVNAGLVVWGSQGSDQGMDACRSWDMRCWEPKPWFLRKYWFLCGGWDDEMWKAARWWHAMRNERIGPRPPDISMMI